MLVNQEIFTTLPLEVRQSIFFGGYRWIARNGALAMVCISE